MKIVVAKAEKRMRDGKDTIFVHNGLVMPHERIENFKRRKTVRESDPASPGAGRVPTTILRVYKTWNS
jgi:hypothetical protein